MVVGDYEVDALLDSEGSFATYAELFDGDHWRVPVRSYDVAVHPAQLSRPGLAYVHDDDQGRASATREQVLSAYDDRALACGHYPGTGFGRMADGIWSPLP